MSRENTELIEVFRGKTLAQNSVTSINDDFPLGEGITRMMLRLNHTVTIGTGSGAISEGELNILKALTLRSDKGERFYNQIPGRALYRYNQYKMQTAGVKDAVAAASATYRVDLDLIFIDPQSVRPFDSILDSSRYRSLDLSIQLGGVADFFTTVGSSSNVTTLDCVVERVKGPLPDGAKPLFYQEVSVAPPVDPSSQTYIDLERAENLSHKRVMIASLNSATAGTPFSGSPNSSVLSDISIETDRDDPVRAVLADMINRSNKKDYQLESAITGFYLLDLMKDGSSRSALFSGDLSRLRVKWNNDTLSTSQVNVLTESLRDLV